MKKLIFFASIALATLTLFGLFTLYKNGINIAQKKTGDDSHIDSEIIVSVENLETQASEVDYYNGVKGYLAKPAAGSNYPGVVMIHEWWGLNDNIKGMAEKLASEGYIVLAVDLYAGKVAQNLDEARQLTGSIDNEESINNMRAAVAYLKSHGAENIAALGWCFGGGQSLQLALSGEKLNATVIYYGNLETDKSKLSTISWPVLGIFGEQDTSIPVDTVNKFDAALDDLKIENEIYIYENVGHAFANPSGQNFAPEETKNAWSRTLNFLEIHLSQKKEPLTE